MSEGGLDKGVKTEGVTDGKESGANAGGGEVLDRLFAVIESRRLGDPNTSHTARLFHKGTRKIAQKVGEEAVETALAAAALGRDELVEESADLLYHLVVLLVAKGIAPEEVARALAKRERARVPAPEAGR